MKVFSLNEKRLRNGWNTRREIPFTEWLFLEGLHGNEWQYTWTGRHRNRGTSSSRTLTLSLSPKIGFKIGPVTVDLAATAGLSSTVMRANQDCPLGNDIARYCSSLPEQLNLGDIGFKVTEK